MATDLTELRQQIEILRAVKQEKARLADIEAAARAAVEEALGGDEVGELDGREVIRWKHIKSNRLDQKLLEKLYPEAAAECRAVVESRRFEVLG